MTRRNYPMLIDRCMGTDEATVVTLRLQVGHTVFNVDGDAKKHPNDHSDHEIGESLAYARALRKLADRLEVHAVMRIEQRCGPFTPLVDGSTRWWLPQERMDELMEDRF